MQVLVAGGAGFIGSHLCERLLHDGHDVCAVDNLVTGRWENVGHLLERPGFQLITADITEPLPPAVPRVDRIYHLASPASPNAESPRSYIKLPLETADANTIGTRRLLERARRDGARFLFASTSEIYGDPEVHPQSESYRGNVSTTGPRSVYDEAKRFGETLAMLYWRTHNVDARVVRIFNTYGERMDPDDGRVMVNFVVQTLRREPLTIYGDGEQTRSFCYVGDLVHGLQSAIEAEDLGGEIFNLGNPDERTIMDFARTVQQVCGVNLPIEFRPLPTDDPTRRCPDITKAQALLGWNPTIGLEDGIRRTVASIRAELEVAHVPLALA